MRFSGRGWAEQFKNVLIEMAPESPKEEKGSWQMMTADQPRRGDE